MHEEGLNHDPKPEEKKPEDTSSASNGAQYTMDVAVKAGQDSMPAGLAKVLELLGNSLDVCDPSGTLEVNSLEFKGSPSEKFLLIATYKNRKGLFEPAKIQIPGLTGKVDGDSMVFQLPVVEGKTTSYIVGVSGIDKKVITKTIDTFTYQKNRELARIEREDSDKKRFEAAHESITKRREELDAAHAADLKASQERVRAQEK